jgi:N-acetylmuramoyl-L-alanine amidase
MRWKGLRREKRREKRRERMSNFNSPTVIIDPGHGGSDNGASYGYTTEDDINLAVGFYLNYELAIANITSLLAREKDENISLLQRSSFANAKNGKLFISIHCDCFHEVTASGMTVHVFKYPSAGALTAAALIARELRLTFPNHRHRGIKKSDFHVLRETQMPAVLIECEFLSNLKARKFLKEPENQRNIAIAIKKGAVNYLKD